MGNGAKRLCEDCSVAPNTLGGDAEADEGDEGRSECLVWPQG